MAGGTVRGGWSGTELLPSYRHSLRITRGLATKARLRGTFDKRYRADVPKLARMAGDLEDVIWWLTTGSAPWWYWGPEPGRHRRHRRAQVGVRPVFCPTRTLTSEGNFSRPTYFASRQPLLVRGHFPDPTFHPTRTLTSERTMRLHNAAWPPAQLGAIRAHPPAWGIGKMGCQDSMGPIFSPPVRRYKGEGVNFSPSHRFICEGVTSTQGLYFFGSR